MASGSREQRIVVVSPHSDDGVLSLGASMSRWARGGAHVELLTVLALDPVSTAPTGGWDRRAGFRTEGEAAQARRGEDTAACAVLENVRAEFGDSLRVGIGVNTGRVIAGTVGGEGKLEFTVIGDPVNVAARVEHWATEPRHGWWHAAGHRRERRDTQERHVQPEGQALCARDADAEAGK